MPFPLIFIDFSNQSEMMRINPDASITILDWNRIIDWSLTPPDDDMGFVVAFCQILRAARDNFIETSVADSDAMGRSYAGDVIVNVRGENPGPGPIYGLTDDYVWQVEWSKLETIQGRIAIDDENAATVGFMNLFFAARDNFVVCDYIP
jgi:hypothetical protein